MVSGFFISAPFNQATKNEQAYLNDMKTIIAQGNVLKEHNRPMIMCCMTMCRMSGMGGPPM